MRTLFRPLAVAAASAALAPLGGARADMKVVATVSVTGLPYGDVQPHAVTTYVKGERAAVISDGGATVYDGATGKVTLLDTSARAYSVFTREDWMRRGGLDEQMAKRVGVSATLNLKPQDGVKAIASRDAKSFTVSGKLTMKPKMGGFAGGGGGMRGGGRRGGGGFPGGGFPGGGLPYQGGGFPGGGSDGPPGGGRGKMSAPKAEVTGSVWIADGPALETGRKDKTGALPFASQMAPPCPLLKPLAEQLTKLGVVPLSSRIEISISAPNGGTATAITASYDVNEIDAGPVDDAVFRVPDGFTLVDAPPAPSLMAMPGR
ncbi:MAG TPA: hypothetical protein VGM37_16665 [Armatimonadota bacterium]|jgi:hypothetical protein